MVEEEEEEKETNFIYLSTIWLPASMPNNVYLQSGIPYFTKCA
jgi:hypothetical protein